MPPETLCAAPSRPPERPHSTARAGLTRRGTPDEVRPRLYVRRVGEVVKDRESLEPMRLLPTLRNSTRQFYLILFVNYSLTE